MSTIYVVTLLATDDERSSIHSLRATLKVAARRGLRTIHARELQINPKHPYVAGARRAGVQANQRREINTMDMKQYAGSQFLKMKDVEAGPIHATIGEVLLGKYNKPDIIFTDGSKLSVNATNARALNRAFGTQSEDWIGGEVELVAGETEYQGEMKKSIIVNPIMPAKPKDGGAAQPTKTKAKSSKSMMDDEIPF